MGATSNSARGDQGRDYLCIMSVLVLLYHEETQKELTTGITRERDWSCPSFKGRLNYGYDYVEILSVVVLVLTAESQCRKSYVYLSNPLSKFLYTHFTIPSE